MTAAAAASLGGGRARNGDAGMYGGGGVCIRFEDGVWRRRRGPTDCRVFWTG